MSLTDSLAPKYDVEQKIVAALLTKMREARQLKIQGELVIRIVLQDGGVRNKTIRIEQEETIL